MSILLINDFFILHLEVSFFNSLKDSLFVQRLFFTEEKMLLICYFLPTLNLRRIKFDLHNLEIPWSLCPLC